MTRRMKDSGIEWIGEIPENWKVMSLKHSLKGLRTGINPRDNFQLGEGNNFYVTIKNFKDGKLFLDEKCDRITDDALEIVNKRADLKVNDILFSSISDEGHIFLIKEKPKNWTINESVFSIRPNEKIIHPKFLAYILPKNYIFTELKSKETGSTFKSIKQDHLKDSKIVVPNMNEQRYIIQFLDKKTEQIENIKSTIYQEIQTLEDYKKSVITEAVTKGLDKNVEMKDSGIEWIGEIPKHWEVSKIKYNMSRKEEKNPGNKEVLSVYREYGVIPKNSRNDNHNITSLDTSNYKYVKPGYLVINKMKAWQGSMGVSQFEGIVSPAYYIYIFISKNISQFYIHNLFRAVYPDEFKRISGGIREGQWDLSAQLFEDTLIIVPPINEQKKIALYIDQKTGLIDEAITAKQKQLEVLEEYKKSLIYEYVTGKKEVEEC